MSKQNRYTEEYKAFTKAVRKRDKSTCQFPSCRSKKKIEVHHCVPFSKAYYQRLDERNALCLCRYHHKMVTGKEALYMGLFFEIIAEKYK